MNFQGYVKRRASRSAFYIARKSPAILEMTGPNIVVLENTW
jgi:hypothetical protein